MMAVNRLAKNLLAAVGLSKNELNMKDEKLKFHLHKYNDASTKLMRQINDSLSQMDQFFAGIRKRTVIHKGKIRQVSSPQVLETESKQVKAPLKLNLDDYTSTDISKFVEAVVELNQDLKVQKKKQFINTFHQITEATGANIDANGRVFWDVYPEMLEKMDIRFDKDGKSGLEIRLNPKTYEKIMETPPTEFQKQRIDEIFHRKRKEYYAQKRPKRLR
jgi:hypothetical protein